MALDPILLWFALFFAVVALARGDGKLWQVKGVLVIGAGAGLVWLWPERAGIIIGTVGLLLLALPLMLSQVVNRMIVAQRFSLGWRIDVLVWLTHPERRWRVQIRTLRALAWAARGRIDDALAVLDAIARDPRAPASMALVARMHVARLQNRWDSFIAMQDWRGEEPSLAVLIRLRGFSATGRVADLVALQAAEGHLLAAQQRGSPAVWAFGLLALLSGCGRTGSLRRLLDGPLRILPDDLRAFSSAIGDLAAGGAAVAPALEILGRLARGKNRDIAAQARAEIAHPRAPARLDDSQRAVVAQAEQGLEAFIAARIENPAARAPPMTWLLIALNLAAYGLEWWRDAVDDTDALLQVGALWPPAVLLDGQWWRVVSACFLHLGWVHLGMNMLSLLVIGAVAERMFGWWRMLAVYAVAGVGANAAVIGLVWAGWFDPEILVGASGAIMGLVGALVAVAARNWWRARTRATRRRLVWLIGVIALQSVLDVATPEISFAAHGFGVLLGFATGLLVGRQAAEASAPPPAVAAARMSPPRIDRRRVILIAGGAAVALLTAAFFPRRYEDAVAQRLLRPDPDPDPD